jgi:hypothetical protein
MKSTELIKSILIVTILFFTSCQEKNSGDKSLKQNAGISEFLGQWTMDIKGGGVGWLEVRKEETYLDGSLLWIGGSVSPVSYIYLAGDVLYVGRDTRKVVRTKDAEGNETRSNMISTWLEVKKEGDKIAGYYLRPKSDGIGLDSTSFTGKKLPDVTAAPDLKTLKFDKPIVLFNGKDISGWKLVEEKKTNGWSVIDGALVNNAVHKEGEATVVQYGNLRTVQEFEDFNLKLEVNVPEHSNSGIYLRGRYEVQVVDSYGIKPGFQNMGALYSRIVPSVSAEKPAGTWQSFDITLWERHLTVILNGTTIIDNQPVYGPTGGALTSDVFAPGPIYLQGDHGVVSFRNIILTPILK